MSAMPCWTNGRRTGGRRWVPGRCEIAVAASSAVRCREGAMSQALRAAVAGATLAAPHRQSCSLPPCGGGSGRGVPRAPALIAKPLRADRSAIM